MIRNRWSLALPLAALVFAACGEAEVDTLDEPLGEGAVEEPLADDYAYSDWDLDADRALGRDEYGAWAGDQDWTELDERGFSETAYGLWDTDDDQVVDEAEWTEGTERWWGDEDYGTWTDWDGDGDSELDVNEVHEAFETRNLYDRVDLDSDAVLDDEELADWWFDVWDFDDDQEIDTTEWDWGSERGYDRIGM